VLAGLRYSLSTVHQMTWDLQREKHENKGVSPRYVSGSGMAHGDRPATFGRSEVPVNEVELC